MSRESPVTTYNFRAIFRAPLPYVFRWCTDYSPEDPRLAKEDSRRRILARSARRVIFEDLYDGPEGWVWSHDVVTLDPPNHWHAEIVGSHREWVIDYRLRELPGGRTELSFRGRRRSTAHGVRNPSQAQLVRELTSMWRNYGRALERDYHSASKRRGRGRRTPRKS